jgi:hypothetical protein
MEPLFKLSMICRKRYAKSREGIPKWGPVLIFKPPDSHRSQRTATGSDEPGGDANVRQRLHPGQLRTSVSLDWSRRS